MPGPTGVVRSIPVCARPVMRAFGARLFAPPRMYCTPRKINDGACAAPSLR